MEADSRGKYAGIKLHLDEKESQAFLDWHTKIKAGQKQSSDEHNSFPFQMAKQVAKAIKLLLREKPEALQPRTPEQIEAAMLRDKAKIEKQLAAKDKWKEVK